ncbi:MAG: ABC transporter ATP-binding protein [Planctomycetota bacterium]|nr:ABC transporter ATP-binding protein [Planctomycetota bacterium]
MTAAGTQLQPQQQHQPLLRVTDLCVRFGTRGPAAVEHASLSLFPQQTLAIVGESGSGKSVTAMSVLGLLPQTRTPDLAPSGTIEFTQPDGRSINLLACPQSQLRSIRGGQIAMIFQEPMTSLNPVLTIGEQIGESLVLHRGSLGPRDRREAAAAALAAVGIDAPQQRLAQYPHEFSGGMRQRVMIAMALACNPSILIADEPTTALDVSVQAQILDLIDGLRLTRKLGVLLITHDLNVVRNRADVVCVMFRGRVVEYGRAPDLLAAPLHPYTAALLQCSPGLGTRGTRLRTVTSLASPELRATIPSDNGPIEPWWPQSGEGRLVRAGIDRWVCGRHVAGGPAIVERPEIAWSRDAVAKAEEFADARPDRC